MKLYAWLHDVAWWCSERNIGWLPAMIYRFLCPYPTARNQIRARDCIATGRCACDNDKSPGKSAMLRAAPDMHAILCELVNPDDFDQHPQDFAEPWHRARAIISKAEGFSP